MRLRSSYADAYTGMGVSLKELKRKEEAEQCFAQVVRLRPNCALSLGNLAGHYLPCAQNYMPAHHKYMACLCQLAVCEQTMHECVRSAVHR